MCADARVARAKLHRQLYKPHRLVAAAATISTSGGGAAIRDTRRQAGASGLGTPPGSIEIDGREHKLWGYTLTLGYGRMLMAEAALD
jgi:hypothetical protein